jgi:uncharacterized membrane protein (UPF0182 family)
LAKWAKWLAIPFAIIVLIIIFNVLKGIWVEWLWFSSLEFSSVYSTILGTKVATFFVAAIIFFLFLTGNFILARRLGPRANIPFLPVEGIKNLRRVCLWKG